MAPMNQPTTGAMASGQTPSAIDRYHRDGFFLAKGLFSQEEMEVARNEAHDVIAGLAKRYDVEGTWTTANAGTGAGATTAPVTLSHCHDLQLHAATFARLLFDERLTSMFAGLMGTENVQLHHNKLFVKPPETGSPFPLHQDWPFFPHRDDSLMAAIVHLSDAPETRGCVQVVPGSNRQGRRAHQGERHWYLDDAALTEAAQPIPAEAGDVLFFSCLTVHGSGVNRSEDARTTWLIQVRDAADVPTLDRHRSPGQGTMLRGRNASNPPPPSPFG